MFHSGFDTVDDSEIRRFQPPGMLLKPCKYWESHYQPQMLLAGFMNHQQVGDKLINPIP